MMIAFLCLIFGMGCPFAGIYLYYLLNNRLTDEPNEFEMKIAVPFAGSLAKNNAGEHISVKEGVNSVSAELFRSLRTTLRFMIPSTQKNPVILVTSSINGEGKSYVATNLAVSLSLLNKKVALVGLDVRKPMLAEYMGLANEGCLTSYLTDESYSMSDLIVPTEFPNLTVLPAGIIPPNPSELLQSDRLDTLFAELRQSYDYIIVDSAPVALVSDTFLLNRLVDMTLYVCRANYTPQNSVDFINQINEQKRLSNIITVLNDVNIDKIGYGYGYGVNTQSGKK
jgi:capsular exopolysaccharide synthesis family protein